MSPRQSSLLLPLSVLLACGHAFAQDATTTSAASPLVITTTDPTVAMGVNRMFKGAAGMPEIGEGKALVLSLDDGGKLSSRDAAAGDWLRIEANPAALMKVFKKEVAQGRMTAGMFGGMALAQSGLDAEAIDVILDAVFDFPNQLDALVVSIPKSYAAGEQMDVVVDLAPKAETWFAQLVTGLKPHAKGLRNLSQSGAMMHAAFDMDFAAVSPLLMPMVELFTGFMIEDDALKAKAKTLYANYMSGYAGPMSMTFDMEDGMRVLVEASDGDAITAAMKDPAWLEITKASADMAGGVVDVNLDALQHRDVTVIESTVELDDPASNPLAKDGKMSTMVAVGGDAMLMSMMGDAKSSIKSLIDLALDAKNARKPLGKLMTMHFDVVRFGAFMASQTGQELGEEAPENIDIGLAKNDKGLHLEVKIK